MRVSEPIQGLGGWCQALCSPLSSRKDRSRAALQEPLCPWGMCGWSGVSEPFRRNTFPICPPEGARDFWYMSFLLCCYQAVFDLFLLPLLPGGSHILPTPCWTGAEWALLKGTLKVQSQELSSLQWLIKHIAPPGCCSVLAKINRYCPHHSGSPEPHLVGRGACFISATPRKRRMWPVWSMPDRADLAFTETINKSMQVPSRLKVADDSSSRFLKRTPSEDFPSCFQMYVPDRLLPAETRDVAFRPLLVNQIRQHCLAVADPLLEPPVPPTIYEEHPVLSIASRSGSQKRKRPAHQSRARKERILNETSQLALCAASQRREGFQETSVILENSLEEIGTTEILAMRKQLAKISGRLRSLEEQYMGWRQKELVIYSVLVSTCLLNMWLWLRR